MDVFSLLKFWRNAGVGGHGDFDDDEEEGSFFDCSTVNVISGFHSDHYQYQQQYHCSKLDGAANLKSSDHTLFFNDKRKRKILPLDSKTPCRSPFRVFMLGFQTTTNNNKDKKEMKLEEEVTIGSLLKRDTSLRNSNKLLDHDDQQKRFSKDVVHRYLNILIKPLYIKVSRRSNHKHPRKEKEEEEKPNSNSAFIFKEVRKHLRKSRSSSSSIAVKSIPSPAARRDDSALQQQDGIQSAILHCKRCYIDSPSLQGCHVLSRSESAPSHGPRISIDEEKRSSI